MRVLGIIAVAAVASVVTVTLVAAIQPAAKVQMDERGKLKGGIIGSGG